MIWLALKHNIILLLTTKCHLDFRAFQLLGVLEMMEVETLEIEGVLKVEPE